MDKPRGKGLAIAYAVVAVVLGLMMCASASFKYIQHPGPVEGIHRVVGVPLGWFPVLATLLLAGGVGLVVGIFKPKIGLYAAAGLVLYFTSAIIAHLRVDDYAGLKGPIVPFLLSVTVLVLRVASMRRLEARA